MMMISTPHDMNLPWRIVASGRTLEILDSADNVVMSEDRYAWSSDWRSEDEYTAEPRNPKHREMVEANRHQLFKLEFIVAAANKTA